MKTSGAMLPNMIRRQENKARLIVEQAKFDYDILLDTESGKIVNCMQYIRANILQEEQSKSTIAYPLDSLVIVILLAYLYGQDNAALISNFYTNNNLALKLLVPGLPRTQYILSKSAINTALGLIDKEFIEQLLKEYFSAIAKHISCQDHITWTDDDTDKSNSEIKVFLNAAVNTYIQDTEVMTDSLKNKSYLIDLITDRGSLFTWEQKQCFHDDSPANHAGFDTVSKNILGVIRQDLTKALGKTTPVSYRFTQNYIKDFSVFDVYEYLARYSLTSK